ncbi:MAG: HAD family hydrolase [Desulforudis sp.]|nr:MAG: HAD family hydrolase [Desulforudis sp.]
MYYNKEVEEVFQELDTGSGGLSTAEAVKRQGQYGPNTLQEAEAFNVLKAVLDQFRDPLIYILLVAAALTAVLGHFIDTWVIMAVVLINAVIGFTQEIKAEQAIRSLATLAAPRARVIRDGEMVEIDSADLVPGDVVLIGSGTKVPADLRLFEVTRLEINESALTGESLGVRKDITLVKVEYPALGDRRNIAYMGTLVLSGRGRGIVVATGRETELGKISEQVASVESAPTPLQVQLAVFGRWIGYGILAISAFAVLLGMAMGIPFVEMLLTGIALAVGAIPEGLPIVVTITLAVGVKQMARRNAIIRQLPAVETLGGTTVIASDKTGTLTKNEMTVQEIYAAGRRYTVSGVGFEPKGDVVDSVSEQLVHLQDNRALHLCLRGGMLANESRLVYDEEHGHKPEGDPTEVALIVGGIKAGLDPEVEERQYPKIDEIPFESDLMYMATLHREAGRDGNIIFIKGAPERVLEMCRSAPGAEGEGSLDYDRVMAEYRRMGHSGLRVLAVACKRVPAETMHLTKELIAQDVVFLGLQGMIDPPRAEAFAAITKANKAGVRVIMVTGDHQITATAIARSLGIIQGERSAVLTGREIEGMSDEELYRQVPKVSIYARVAPLHKLRIVQQLIRRGEVVAVTGDGVNDTPALKAAHIGVAMGRTGTDAAKETSDMIITDDNFASIFAAVREGRVVFDNIRKVILFLLSAGVGQVLLILVSLVLFLPLPLLPAQILWLNLVTNGLQDVALAFEPEEKGILDRPPRRGGEPVISRLMAERMVILGLVMAAGTLFTFIWQLGLVNDVDKARTVALTTLVLFQLFNVFNVRSETESILKQNLMSNKFLFYSVVASITAQIAVIYVPALQFVFRTVPLTLDDWVAVIGVATTVLVVVEIEKALRRHVTLSRAAAPAKRK